jgi:hypothetical protein
MTEADFIIVATAIAVVGVIMVVALSDLPSSLACDVLPRKPARPPAPAEGARQ